MQARWIRLFLFLFLLAVQSNAAQALEDVRVRVINAITNAPVANLSVTLKRRTIGSTSDFVWSAARTTDAAGNALFSVDVINSSEYRLETRPFSNAVMSSVFQRGGSISLRVGNLPVQLTDATGRRLTSTAVILKRVEANGQLTWISSATTDSNGATIFDPPNLSATTLYQLEAKSPWDGSTKRSASINRPQSFAFVVGNRPLVVRLQDGVSNQIIPNQNVHAFELQANGQYVWRHQMLTNSSGQISFDLDGLGQGRQYQLRTVYFNNLNRTSETLTQTGNYTFAIGKLRALVRNGHTGVAMPNVEIQAKERQADGTLRWVSGGMTDAAGVLRLDLPGITQGRAHVLTGISPIDGTTKSSQAITVNGAITFTLGNHPVRVRVEDGLTHASLAGRTVTAKEILSNGSELWVSSHLTDAQGYATFDLDGLGVNRRYQFSTVPYNGGTLRSAVLTSTADVLLSAGTLLVTLQNGDLQNQPMAGKTISLSQWQSNAPWIYVGQGVTDALGQVHFNTTGLSTANRYVVRTQDPYGVSKVYFSPLLAPVGRVAFRITRAGDYALDVRPPVIAITAPGNGSSANIDGFLVQGTVRDDHQVDKILVLVSEEASGRSVGEATIQAGGQWQFRVPAGQIHASQPVQVTAMAVDLGHNYASVSVQLIGVEDLAPPTVSILSHSENAEVLPQGFLLSGLVDDDVGIESLQATLVDPIRGTLQRDLTASVVNGEWDWILYGGQISVGSTVAISVTARDVRQHVTTQTLHLRVTDHALVPRQIINRVTFGATPTLLEEVSAMGATTYLLQQLHPENIDDSALQTQLANFQPTNSDELALYSLMHATHSRRQLQEVMTWFWDNHFNTDIRAHGRIEDELAENRAFRQHALGNFRDLLSISAHSPAMLRYLNNAQSHRTNPNENYGRELLELHTLGVTGGYTQEDVVAVARAFTGWTLQNNIFYYDATRHDNGEKRLLGQVIPAGGGQADGDSVLDLLARHPATARFICTKLSRLLISDNPSQTLVTGCANTFLQSNGNITATLEMLLSSPEFSSVNNFRSKVRSPLEFVAGTLRLLEQPATIANVYDITKLGMPLYRYPVPTGYSETGDDYLNSDQWLKRIRLVNQMVTRSNVNMVQYFDRHGYNSKEGVAGFLQDIALDDQRSWTESMETLEELGTDFRFDQADAETRLRAMTGLLLSLPAYSLQ